MDIFGKNWDNHEIRFETEWKKIVRNEDTVVIPGDISWGSNFEEAYADLKFINDLPGHKLIGKGNHDYWWATMNKLTNFKKEKKLDNIDFLFNNAYFADNRIICGTRGWINEFGVKREDEKIIKREAQRLELSLKEGLKLKEDHPDGELTVFLHYPPVFGEFINYDIVDVLYRYNVGKVYFGHLHNVREEQLDKEYIGIKLQLVSCDYVDFKPVEVV